MPSRDCDVGQIPARRLANRSFGRSRRGKRRRARESCGVPDWTYHPIARPLLSPLAPRRRRELLLGAIEIVAKLPGGATIVRTFGDTAPFAGIAFERGGERWRSPIGLASGVDPRGSGRLALGSMGFGFLEVDVSVEARLCGALDVDERTRTIHASAVAENRGLEATVAWFRTRDRDVARGDVRYVFPPRDGVPRRGRRDVARRSRR